MIEDSETLNPSKDIEDTSTGKDINNPTKVQDTIKVNEAPAAEHKEINSLLGETSSLEQDDLKKNVLFSKHVYYERLPMLEVIFDRFVRILSSDIRNLTSTNTDITIEDIKATRVGIYLSNMEKPSVLGIIKAEEWGNQGLIHMDRNLALSLFNILLGNRNSTIFKTETKPYTLIEQNFLKRVLEIITENLTNAFSPITPINFKFTRLETNPKLAIITRANNVAILLRLKIKMNDKCGIVEILIPNETLEPVREILLQSFMGEKFGQDSIWEQHLSKSLWHTDLGVHACFPELTMPLNDVLKWEIGSKISFNTMPSDPMEVRCGDHLIALGKIGQKTGKVAIRLDQIYRKGHS
jgi:flagellar motor switch protein FliM